MRERQFFQAKNNEKTLSLLAELEQSIPPKEIAYSLNIPVQSYYRIRSGFMQFPFDKIPELAKLHEGVLELILEPLGRLSFPKVDTNGNYRKSVKDTLLEFPSLDGRLIDTVLKIVADGKVTVDEYNKAHRLLNQHQRLSAMTDEMLLRRVTP